MRKLILALLCVSFCILLVTPNGAALGTVSLSADKPPSMQGEVSAQAEVTFQIVPTGKKLELTAMSYCTKHGLWECDPVEVTIEGIGSIKELKRAMERRTPDPREVKAGPGGIRDVEFLVQGLQLIHGPERPWLVEGSTLRGLYALQEANILPPQEANRLTRIGIPNLAQSLNSLVSCSQNTPEAAVPRMT